MSSCTYVSRGGLKLEAALDAFAISVCDKSCADLGCNVGGFTDCLLQRGSARVYAVDTGYGPFAWKLRQDDRVVVLERINALYLDPALLDGFTGCDLVTIDLGWTRQQWAVPAAMRWLEKSGASGRIITLIKPHYEVDRALLKKGVLDDHVAEQVAHQVMDGMTHLGAKVLSHIRSPIRGGAGKNRAGNIEFLALLQRA